MLFKPAEYEEISWSNKIFNVCFSPGETLGGSIERKAGGVVIGSAYLKIVLSTVTTIPL